MLLLGSLLVCLCDAFVAAAAAAAAGEKLHCTSIGRDAGRLPSELT